MGMIRHKMEIMKKRRWRGLFNWRRRRSLAQLLRDDRKHEYWEEWRRRHNRGKTSWKRKPFGKKRLLMLMAKQKHRELMWTEKMLDNERKTGQVLDLDDTGYESDISGISYDVDEEIDEYDSDDMSSVHEAINSDEEDEDCITSSNFVGCLQCDEEDEPLFGANESNNERCNVMQIEGKFQDNCKLASYIKDQSRTVLEYLQSGKEDLQIVNVQWYDVSDGIADDEVDDDYDKLENISFEKRKNPNQNGIFTMEYTALDKADNLKNDFEADGRAKIIKNGNVYGNNEHMGCEGGSGNTIVNSNIQFCNLKSEEKTDRKNWALFLVSLALASVVKVYTDFC